MTNIFEKHAKLTLLAVNLFFIAIIIVFFRVEIFQDAPNAEKYSLYDLLEYKLRCSGKRNIVLRENAPNISEYRNPPYDRDSKYRFRTDENGFVLPSKVYENPDVNIFFLGGSTTECEFVDEEYRFPYLVGKILSEKTGKEINSYNAGKSGNNSLHSVNNLLNKVIPMNPHIVVRMENINDLSTLLYEQSFWNRNKSRSNLGCFSKKVSNLRNFKNEWEESPYRNMIFDKKHQEKIKQEYRLILRIFISITRASKAIPVLMTQFNRIEKDPNFSVGKNDQKFDQAYRQLYADFNEIVRNVAAEENVVLIDLAREVPIWNNYLYDSVHLNNEGSKLVSEIIAWKLQRAVMNINNK